MICARECLRIDGDPACDSCGALDGDRPPSDGAWRILLMNDDDVRYVEPTPSRFIETSTDRSFAT